MENLESKAGLHKIKAFLHGTGMVVSGSAGILLTYNFVKVLFNNSDSISNVLPTVSDSASFGDLMFANAVAWTLTYKFYECMISNYQEFRRLRNYRDQ